MNSTTALSWRFVVAPETENPEAWSTWSSGDNVAFTIVISSNQATGNGGQATGNGGSSGQYSHGRQQYILTDFRKSREDDMDRKRREWRESEYLDRVWPAWVEAAERMDIDIPPDPRSVIEFMPMLQMMAGHSGVALPWDAGDDSGVALAFIKSASKNASPPKSDMDVYTKWWAAVNKRKKG